MAASKPWDADEARALVAGLAELPGAMLPMLHALHDEYGYIDKEAIPLVAEVLNVSRAEVVGVVNFYHDFRQEPGGRHTLKVCRAEACQSMGGEKLVDHLAARLRIVPGQTTADGAFSLEPVYCLGNCALSPALMLDGKLYGRVTHERADSILAGVGS